MSRYIWLIYAGIIEEKKPTYKLIYRYVPLTNPPNIPISQILLESADCYLGGQGSYRQGLLTWLGHAVVRQIVLSTMHYKERKRERERGKGSGRRKKHLVVRRLHQICAVYIRSPYLLLLFIPSLILLFRLFFLTHDIML